MPHWVLVALCCSCCPVCLQLRICVTAGLGAHWDTPRPFLCPDISSLISLCLQMLLRAADFCAGRSEPSFGFKPIFFRITSCIFSPPCALLFTLRFVPQELGSGVPLTSPRSTLTPIPAVPHNLGISIQENSSLSLTSSAANLRGFLLLPAPYTQCQQCLSGHWR